MKHTCGGIRPVMCKCMSCKNDIDSCCVRKDPESDICPVTECPDYEKEKECAADECHASKRSDDEAPSGLAQEQ